VIDLSPEAWVFLGTTATAVTTLLGDGYRTRRRVGEVRELAEPTGNGFAATVKGALERIERDIREVRVDLSRHLHDHAAGSIRPTREEPR
jgi:hypothetical protein